MVESTLPCGGGYHRNPRPGWYRRIPGNQASSWRLPVPGHGRGPAPGALLGRGRRAHRSFRNRITECVLDPLQGRPDPCAVLSSDRERFASILMAEVLFSFKGGGSSGNRARGQAHGYTGHIGSCGGSGTGNWAGCNRQHPGLPGRPGCVGEFILAGHDGGACPCALQTCGHVRGEGSQMDRYPQRPRVCIQRRSDGRSNLWCSIEPNILSALES